MVACAVQSRLRNSERRGCVHRRTTVFDCNRSRWSPFVPTAPSCCVGCCGPPKSKACVPGSMRTSPTRARVPRWRAPGGSGLVHRGLLLLAGEYALPQFHFLLSARRGSRGAHGQPLRAAVSRSHAHQGTGHPGAHALAPGPAVLQHRGRAELQLLDSGGPRAPRVHAGVCRRLAPGSLAHAALVHGRTGEVVPRRHPRRSAGHRGAARRSTASSAGRWSRGMPCASTC